VCFSISYGITTISDQDSDFDGYSNRLELAGGSDPLNPEDDPFTREWSNLGLYGGQIYDIEFDPSNHAKMLAGAYYGDGLFRSRDGSQTWEPVLTGLEGGRLEGEATFRNTIVYAIQYAPSDPDTVWTVHDVWAEKSIDGGETWTHFYNSRMQRTCSNCGGDGDDGRYCRSLAIDPEDPETVYVGTGGPIQTYTRGAIYKTTDGGTTWTKTGFDNANEFDYTVVDLAIDPNHPGTIWALTYSFGTGGESSSLYRSEDYGANWEHVFSIKTELADLKLWPSNPAIVLIASWQGLLSNITGNWEYIYGTDPCCTRVRALAFDPQDPDVLYAAVQGRGIVRGVYDHDSNNFIIGQWTELGLDFVTLTVHPANGNVIFGGGSRDGVFKLIYDSVSDGFDLNEQNEGINALSIYDIDVIPAAGSNPAYLIAATIRGFVYKIGEGEWTYVSKDGLPAGISRSVAFDPTISDGTAFYVGGDQFVAKTLDRGSTWATVSDNLPLNKRIYQLAVAPNGSTLYAAAGHYGGGDSGGVYKSTNSGAQFTEVLVGEGYGFNTVIIDPTDSDRILAGGGNFYAPPANGHLYESIDGGDSWTLTGLTDVVVKSLLIDPEDPDTIYAGCGSGGASKVPLFKSTDGGVTWQPTYSGMPGRPTRYGVWGSAATDVFMLGHTGSIFKGGYDDRKILHYDGTGWTNKDTGVLDHLHGIWGSSAQNIIAVGERGAIIRYDGSGWSAMEADNNRTTPQNLKAVWGSSGSDCYAVGDGGTILRYNGGSWVSMAGPTNANLYGVWGHANGSRVYAVGSTGTILRYEAGSWVPEDSGVKARLSGVWGTPDGTRIYVTGDPESDGQGNIRNMILSSNGTGWTRMDTPIVAPGRGRLHGVWGFANNNVFAVGDDGVILHFDGNQWSPMTSGTTTDLYAVWGANMSSVFAVGRYGTILHYNSSQWNPIDTDTSGQPVEGWTYWNSVTDLKFKLDAGGNRNIYAATLGHGIYLSPNQAETWINLLAPPYKIHALEVGSIYVASYGVYAFQGVGFVAGEVKDELTLVGIDHARVSTDAGFWTSTNRDGVYVLPLLAGNYNITGDADGYKPETAHNVPSIVDGNVVNFYLTDPVVYVRINGADVLAANGTFEGAFGSIAPAEGVYRWSSGGGNGYLYVPFPYGWARLAITPEDGCKIENVWINNIPHGELSEFTFSNLQGAQTIEVLFEEAVSACAGDLDTDGDVDGLDIGRYISGQQNGVSVAELAAGFGRTDCLP
jgi:photosystem II stability/assembly factor-like uncharacterized protein